MVSNIAAKLSVFLIGFISSAFRVLGARSCRFYPSCSAYASGAFLRFGFFRAWALASARILRCHPFTAGGYHPLPESRFAGKDA